jgi:hypothetical protein
LDRFWTIFGKTVAVGIGPMNGSFESHQPFLDEWQMIQTDNFKFTMDINKKFIWKYSNFK